jgi:dipeptidyl aminopeptidase/acylaminoacyl peptidase
MKTLLFPLSILTIISPLKLVVAAENSENKQITPHKFTDKDSVMPFYTIPASSIFTAKRPDVDAPDIVYYLSKPQLKNQTSQYPIAILCGGSSSKDDIGSIIHFHRYFLKEFMDLRVGVLTLEQWGVDGKTVNKQEFIKHYTRSQRLKDHKTVIEHLKLNPPSGWNGKLIFLGVSEGGSLVITLTADYPKITLATISWSGAGDWSWREELWEFVQKLPTKNPPCPHNTKLNNCPTCLDVITSRDRYDARMDATIDNSTADYYFFNMSYKYHADAQQYPAPNYQKIRTPFLMVTGAQDTIILSSDAFVEKAKNASVKLTYLRVPDMDHYVRKRPDVVQESFEWLENVLK